MNIEELDKLNNISKSISHHNEIIQKVESFKKESFVFIASRGRDVQIPPYLVPKILELIESNSLEKIKKIERKFKNIEISNL
ncbi:hypothetical protein ACTS94_16315 [Empedobacter falsenii]